MARNKEGAFSSTIHRIAIVSISLSLAALIVSFFVLYGFKGAIKEKVYNLSGHLTVNKYALSTSYEETSIIASDSLIGSLNGNPKISGVQAFVLKAGLIKTEEEVQGIIMKGVGLDFNTAGFESQMILGRFPDLTGQTYSTEVAISQYMSNLLRLKIGDKVTLYFAQEPPRYRRIEVVGVYTTGMEEFDERIVFGDIRMLQRINQWESNQVTGLEVMITDPSQIDQMEEELFDWLDIDLNVVSANRQYPQIFEWLELLNRNVLILLVIILVVAAMGMISMVLILIMERTKMIGILKALGTPNRMLRNVFFFSGLDLILKGLLVGNGVGLFLCGIQHQFKIIPLDVANYYMRHVPISFDLPTLLGLNVLIIVMVSTVLFIPIRIVSDIQPIHTIRFD